MVDCKIVKRVFLFTLLPPFVALIPHKSMDFTRNVYYTTITIIVASYVFLINFPAIIQMFHTRPLSFQDLEDPKYVNPAVRKRFQIIFIIMLQIFGAIMITGMADYYLYRYQQSSLSRFEILGVAGGFISLLSKIERLTGNALLTVLNHIKIRSPNAGPRSNSRFKSVIRKISESLSDIHDTPHLEKKPPPHVSDIELGPVSKDEHSIAKTDGSSVYPISTPETPREVRNPQSPHLGNTLPGEQSLQEIEELPYTNLKDPEAQLELKRQVEPEALSGSILNEIRSSSREHSLAPSPSKKSEGSVSSFDMVEVASVL